ncbi:MAG: MarR family transcriptional regulator [Oscillospiraceae bacterium]|nr:MarR family transcriptional regulator [Oscillospiraceae bacterium]
MDGIFESMYLSKELITAVFDPICERYGLTLTELLVLLHLKRDETHNTATDIVHRLKLAKSYVSTSVRRLEQRGYVRGYYTEQNRRSIRLQLCDTAREIVEAGERAQAELLEVVLRGFTPEEVAALGTYLHRITENTNSFLHTI